MIAAHSDWSVAKSKRWITIGQRSGNRWVLDVPQPTGDIENLLRRLIHRSKNEAVVLGIDCPIGLPRAYAEQLEGHAGFVEFLKSLPPESEFFIVARTLEEVSISRPFYPAGNISGPGHKLALAKKLNLSDTALLSRRSDLRTANRPAAGQLFWTLGANQCGKAALAAWRDLLIPAFKMAEVKLWPFDGPLRDLAIPGQIAIAETYPAEAMRQLGLKLKGSKRDQNARTSLSCDFVKLMKDLNIVPSSDLALTINDGFGNSAAGEDQFDSFIGALGIIKVLDGATIDTSPYPADRWEGWILGQDHPL